MQNPPPMVVTLHGHDGWAFDDFYVWHDFLKQRGYGFLAVQWWLGEGEGINDYLLPNEIYRTIDEVFRKLAIKPGTALLHGFSRGSTNTYAGAKDPNPERDGIQGMRETAAWIEKYGGTVDLTIEDPDGSHGGFHRNPKNTNASLDVFDKLRSR